MGDDRVDLLGEGMLTVRQGAEFCGLSRTTLYAEMAAGRLPWIAAGRKRLIPRRALIEWLAERVRGGWAFSSTTTRAGVSRRPAPTFDAATYGEYESMKS